MATVYIFLEKNDMRRLKVENIVNNNDARSDLNTIIKFTSNVAAENQKRIATTRPLKFENTNILCNALKESQEATQVLNELIAQCIDTVHGSTLPIDVKKQLLEALTFSPGQEYRYKVKAVYAIAFLAAAALSMEMLSDTPKLWAAYVLGLYLVTKVSYCSTMHDVGLKTTTSADNFILWAHNAAREIETIDSVIEISDKDIGRKKILTNSYMV